MADNTLPCGAPKEFRHVQPGSRVELWMEGPSCTAFLTDALVGSDTGSSQIDHEVLCRPPGDTSRCYSFAAQKGFLYTITLLTRFLSQQPTAVFVNLRIIKGLDPQGNPIFHNGTPYRCSMTGKSGDPTQAHHFVIKVRAT